MIVLFDPLSKRRYLRTGQAVINAEEFSCAYIGDDHTPGTRWTIYIELVSSPDDPLHIEFTTRTEAQAYLDELVAALTSPILREEPDAPGT